MEEDGRAGLVGVADDLDFRCRLAEGVCLLPDMALAAYGGHETVGQGIDARHADAMQAARHLVGTLVELTAGMEHGHDDLEGRAMLLLVHVDGDAAAVVDHAYRIIFQYRHFDVRGIACHTLVDGVVDHLRDEMVKTFDADVADVHGGALADGLKAFEHLDATR